MRYYPHPEDLHELQERIRVFREAINLYTKKVDLILNSSYTLNNKWYQLMGLTSGFYVWTWRFWFNSGFQSLVDEAVEREGDLAESANFIARALEKDSQGHPNEEN